MADIFNVIFRMNTRVICSNWKFEVIKGQVIIADK